MQEPQVVFESYLGGRSFSFCNLQNVVVAHELNEVDEALKSVDRAVANGFHAAGYIGYEAAGGLNERLLTHQKGDLPLLWFGIFEERTEIEAGKLHGQAFQLSDWRASIGREVYDQMMACIRAYIVAGDTYQVNYTFRLRADFQGDPLGFYQHLCQNQRTNYSAFLDIGTHQILSASPELFFALNEGVLTTRPMKGTWPRGRWYDEDMAHRKMLSESEKNRAENVMIVDLLRNDLGRVSTNGSVAVSTLWDIEQYETVFQMTSTVQSKIKQGIEFSDLIHAMFPCGSVTGAPKVRTMEIIKDVETDPRGVYTGSIGYVSPGGETCFNVAIRTVCINAENQIAEFGVGGGITFDSSPDGEFDECLTKARILGRKPVRFDLFETLRYDPKLGYFLLSYHLDRLRHSARYFGFMYDQEDVLKQLQERALHFDEQAHRVRCVLSRDGGLKIESAQLAPPKKGAWRVGIAKTPVDSKDVFLYHKTTAREVYEKRLAERPECDEVLLLNEREEVTECTIGNLVVQRGERFLTPTIESGLLAGTFRRELLAQGQLTEDVLTLSDVRSADMLFMINSVREWVPLTFID